MVTISALAGRRSAVIESHPLAVQIARFVMVGGLGTAVNALVFLVLRTGLDTIPANLVALITSTLVSTEVNRRFTFGGAAVSHWRTSVQNGGTVAFYAVCSYGVLALVEAAVDDPSPSLQAFALVAASLFGGACRYLVMRFWVFGER